MKNLILMALAICAFSSSILGNESNYSPINDTNIAELDLVVVASIKVNGENKGTTVIEVTSTDGSTTTVLDIKCDNNSNDTCYTIEASEADKTKIEIPSEGKTFKGVLIDSNPVVHKYKLLNM